MYFAIPLEEGDFDIRKLSGGSYTRCFSGRTPSDVLKKVSDLRDCGLPLPTAADVPVPRSVRQGSRPCSGKSVEEVELMIIPERRDGM